jgi:electron-transferring-flavoprotein dehydrogenase
MRRILDGGERLEWGAKTIPEGGFLSLPKQLHAPGLLLCGDGVGMVNVPALKGIHYALESGRLAADAAYRALQPGESVGRRGALQSYDDAVRESYIWTDLKRVRNVRPAFSRGFWLGSALAGGAISSFGKLPPKDETLERDVDHELLDGTGRAASYPAPDGKLTFDKLSSVFASGNRTRDDQPSHIRIETRVPRDLAEMWARLCPAQVYEVGAEDAGKVHVQVTPSNCVQCGAITAKGGRLTPPEGGSGPEYSRS